MQVVLVQNIPSVRIDELTTDPDELRLIVSVLMGDDERSAELLREVLVGSVPHTMGALKTLYVVLDHVPTATERPHGSGVYAMQDWVIDSLSPVMPEGWIAAMSQPIMMPLAWNKVMNCFQIINTWDALHKKDLVVSYLMIVSPIKITDKRPIHGYYINDDVEGPTLIPIG
jgi:hypothetical protein